MWKFPSILAAFAVVSCDAAGVIFEAESGALGLDRAAGNSASPAFVTIRSNSSANNPGTPNRVAIFVTHAPVMPFSWTNNTANNPMNFFRIRVGPSLP